MSRIAATAATVAVVGLSLVTVGCPGTDVLQTLVAVSSINVAPTNVGTTRYEQVMVQINEILVRPADPDLLAASGPAPITLVSGFPVTVDIVQGGSLPDVTLSPGEYEVRQLDISNVTLIDNDPPAMPATCIENLGTVPAANLSLGAIGGVINVPGNQTVTASDGGSITMTIDVGVFIAAAEGPVLCQNTPCGGNPVCINPNYRDDVFRANAAPALTFN